MKHYFDFINATISPLSDAMKTGYVPENGLAHWLHMHVHRLQ